LPTSNAVQSPRKRAKRGPADLLQLTAPEAAKNVALNDFWSSEYIIAQQADDSVLSIVKDWIMQGERPDFDQIPSNPAVKTYFQLFDSLVLVDGIMY